MFKFFCLIGFLTTISAAIFLTDEDDKNNINLVYASSADAAEFNLDETNSNVLDAEKTTVILIHGWIEGNATKYYPVMFAEYIKKGGYNVIRVVWGKYSKNGYLTAKFLVERVGNFVGKFINHIHKNNGIHLDKVHIVGHSLGAHVAGFAGQAVKSVSGVIGRITGLDPAGPAFDYLTSDTRKLDPTDAKMVDCEYTNRGVFGTADVLGTHNFYVNDATFQPGCPFDSDEFTSPLFCNHQRSTSVFSESINSDRFVAVKISDFGLFGATGIDESVKVIFGENTNATAGSYWFKTGSKRPYALG